jgi:hypothetical protein
MRSVPFVAKIWFNYLLFSFCAIICWTLFGEVRDKTSKCSQCFMKPPKRALLVPPTKTDKAFDGLHPVINIKIVKCTLAWLDDGGSTTFGKQTISSSHAVKCNCLHTGYCPISANFSVVLWRIARCVQYRRKGSPLNISNEVISDGSSEWIAFFRSARFFVIRLFMVSVYILISFQQSSNRLGS